MLLLRQTETDEGPPDPGPALGTRASEDLRFIRDAMQRASAFTAVPGYGWVWMGVTSMVAALLSAPLAGQPAWLALWLGQAAVAAGIGTTCLVRKARRLGAPLFSAPGRRFTLGVAPPMLAGAFLTLVFVRADLSGDLPGLWLLVYGVAVVTSGAYSVRPVPIAGAAFMLAGVTTFVLPGALGTVMLAVGFGGLHVLFGIWIARRYGG